MPTPQIILEGMEFIVAAYCLNIGVFSVYNDAVAPETFDPSTAPGTWITLNQAGTGFIEVEKQATPPDTAPKVVTDIQAGNQVCNNLTYEAIVNSLFYDSGIITPAIPIAGTSHWLELAYQEGKRCAVPAQGKILPLRVLIWTTFKYHTAEDLNTSLRYSLGNPEEIVFNANSPYIINDSMSFGGGSSDGILYGTGNVEYNATDRFVTGASARIKIWGAENTEALRDLVFANSGRGVSLYVGTDTSSEFPLLNSTVVIDENNIEDLGTVKFSFVATPGSQSYRHYYPHANHVVSITSMLSRPINLPEPISEASVCTLIRELSSYSNTGSANFIGIKTNATTIPYVVETPDTSMSISVPKKNFVIFGKVREKVQVNASLSIGAGINGGNLTPTVTAAAIAPYDLYDVNTDTWTTEAHESPSIPVVATAVKNIDGTRSIVMELNMDAIMAEVSTPDEMFIAHVALTINVTDGTISSEEVVENVKLIVNASKGTVVAEPSYTFGTGAATDRIISASFVLQTRTPITLGFNPDDFEPIYLYRMSSVFGDGLHGRPRFNLFQYFEIATTTTGGGLLKQKFTYSGNGIYARIGSNIPIRVTFSSDGFIDGNAQRIELATIVYSYLPAGTEFNSTTKYVINLDGTVSYLSSIGGSGGIVDPDVIEVDDGVLRR